MIIEHPLGVLLVIEDNLVVLQLGTSPAYLSSSALFWPLNKKSGATSTLFTFIDKIKRVKETNYFTFSQASQAKANKTGFNILIVHFYIHRKLDMIQDFSVWLRTGSNPADINRFRSHGKIY